MKKLILTLFLTLSIFVCWGWEFELKGLASESITPLTSTELPNGDILILCTKQTEYGNPDSIFSNNLLRISSNGNLIDNLEYSNHITGYKFHGSGIIYVNNEIIICGTAIDSLNNDHPALLKLSENLVFLHDTVFNFNGQAIKIWTLPDSSYIIWGITGDVQTGTGTFWKLDENFSIKKTGFINTPWFIDGEPCLSPSWKHFYFRYNIYGFKRWNVSNFSLDKFYQPRNSSIYLNTPVISEEGDFILFAGMIIDPLRLQHNNLLLYKLDDNLNPLDSAIYQDFAENRLPDLTNAIANINDHFYLGASNNQPSRYTVNEKTLYSSFMLLKYEEDMNLVWAKKYRNDCTYRMTFLMKTHDNGILMVGERWNWPEDSLKKEVSLYALKVNEDGNPTGVDENKFNDRKLTIYPNPSTNFTHINLSGKEEHEVKTIKVINTLGESVYHSEFTGSQFKIDSSKWPVGTYFISVSTTSFHITKRFIKL